MFGCRGARSLEPHPAMLRMNVSRSLVETMIYKDDYMTRIPLDDNGAPIPALALRPGRAHQITAGAASARNATPFQSDTKIVSVFSTVPVFINFGDTSVTATNTSHYFPANMYYDFAVGSATNLAVLQASSGGTVYISEKN